MAVGDAHVLVLCTVPPTAGHGQTCVPRGIPLGDGRMRERWRRLPTVAPNLRGEPSPSPTPTPPPTATPTPAVEDRLRQVILTNRTLHEVDLDLRVTEGDEVVFEAAPTLAGEMEWHSVDMFEPEGTYDVAVGTSDGRSRTFEWEPGDWGDNLWISLRRRIVARNSYDIDVSGEFLTGDPSVLRDGQERDWSSFVVENPDGATDARIEFSDGEESRDAIVEAPERSLLWLPVSLPSSTVGVDVPVDGTEGHTTWRTRDDGQLYLALDGPRFSCDRLYRDLRVANESDAEWAPRVSVLTDGRTAFAETVSVEPGSNESVPGVVPPARRNAVLVESGGASATFELPECPPIGPVVATLDADGIDVAVRARKEPVATTAAETGTGN